MKVEKYYQKKMRKLQNSLGIELKSFNQSQIFLNLCLIHMEIIITFL